MPIANAITPQERLSKRCRQRSASTHCGPNCDVWAAGAGLRAIALYGRLPVAMRIQAGGHFRLALDQSILFLSVRRPSPQPRTKPDGDKADPPVEVEQCLLSHAGCLLCAHPDHWAIHRTRVASMESGARLIHLRNVLMSARWPNTAGIRAIASGRRAARGLRSHDHVSGLST